MASYQPRNHRFCPSQEGSPAERRAQTRAAYEAWLARTKPEVTLTWRDDEGDVTARVTADTATADLVVMRNPAHLDGRDAFHSVLFNSRRLLLVAPPDPLPVRPVIGRHMVVGWKPGPPAERAVRGAAPWLRKAAHVSVFCVRLPDRASYLNSARAMLAEIGVAAEPGVVEREGQSVGGQLLVEAKRLGGDSLVIGAFHRGALLRTILGGVTRDVLADLRLPVFMHC